MTPLYKSLWIKELVKLGPVNGHMDNNNATHKILCFDGFNNNLQNAFVPTPFFDSQIGHRGHTHTHCSVGKLTNDQGARELTQPICGWALNSRKVSTSSSVPFYPRHSLPMLLPHHPYYCQRNLTPIRCVVQRTRNWKVNLGLQNQFRNR
jgi:hypothetical protein